MDKMNQAFEKMKMLVGMEVEDEEEQQQESSLIDDFNRNCTLSTKQRLYGFAICLASGITFTLLSMLVFFNPIKFGITFSFGNLLALGRFIFLHTYFSSNALAFVILPVYDLQGGIQSSLNYMLSVAFSSFGQMLSSITNVFLSRIWLIYAYFLNLIFILHTAFLIGPKRQLTMMLDPVRIYATAIYIASIIIALFCAVYVRNKLLTFLGIILEFGALIWYSLSYIPFARSMVSKIMTACFDTEF
ncbi:hypothetical protein ACJIZ3_002377 [Penstemon smallii]|uniref:Vesicle transport protein n=1 Tax=Penstemon smallii TaxID=265156 RepID=A0ABD3U685_9LAMI